MADNQVDEELVQGLRQARKKPRNFALITKGPKVLHLIVQKKPIKAGELQKAKTEYKGNAIIRGVCEGDGGAGMVFRVLEEDPGIKIPQFREFISEKTELTIKPRFEVVTEIVEVDDDADDDANETPPTAPPPPQGTSTTSETPPPPPPMPETTSQQPPPPPPPPPTGDDALAKQLVAALNKLAPALKQAVAANPARKDELLRPAAQIQQFIQTGRLDDARQQLLSLGQLLKSVTTPPNAPPQPPPPQSSTTPPPPPPSPDQVQDLLGQKWNEEFARVEPQYLEALQLAPSDLASKLRVTFTYATEQAEAGQYSKALAALARLEPMLNEAKAQSRPGATGEVAEGTVEKRKFLLTRFQKLPGEIRPRVDELKRAIEDKVPEEDAGELCGAIESALQDLYTELQNEIDNAINQGDMSLVKGVRGRIEKHALLNLLAQNPLTAGEAFRQTLLTAVDEVEERLAG